ncbi:MAG: hypothetical protein ACM3ZC_05400 [Bacteroidota bacterium]
MNYNACSMPYDLNNGITADLQTGDVKIAQTDLVLPGRGGLDLALTRVYSARANLRSNWGWFYHGAFGSPYTDAAAGARTLYGDFPGPWAAAIPCFADLKDFPSESILTEPMPGWTYDLPRVTPLYVYCDGRLYPNCLEAERHHWGLPVNYYWAQGCEKIGDTYYYRDGNFRLAKNGDDSVVLTKADGTAYTFPCFEQPEEGGWSSGWLYGPLASITDKTGANTITFAYDGGMATITDSAGRQIVVSAAGVSVNGTPVVSFNVSHEGEWNWCFGGDDYERIVYMVTDAAGRTSTVTAGFEAIDVVSATGAATHLDFALLDAMDCIPDDGLVLTGGIANGRELSVTYEHRRDRWDTIWGFDVDTIIAMELTDGEETVTADFAVSELHGESIWGGDALYGIACPGPATLDDGHRISQYTYEPRQFGYTGGMTQANNYLDLLTGVQVSQGESSYTRTLGYDAACNLVSTAGPDGTATYTYRTIDTPERYFVGVETVTHGPQTIAYGYDDRGLLEYVINGDAPPAQYSYDTYGNVSSIVDPKGNTTQITYDDAYHLLPKTVTAGDRVQSYEYFYPFGWLKSTTAGPYATSYTYDAAGRVLTATDASGTTTTQYNDDERWVETTDPEGYRTKSFYDPLGRTTLDESYDPSGIVLGRTSYAYDPQHDRRLASISDFGVVTQTYAVDEDANTSTVTDADGNTSTTRYDLLGRTTQTETTLAEGEPQITTYTYDPLTGALASVTDPARTVEYHYNSRGLVDLVTYSDGKTEETLYDANGNPEQVKDRSGRWLTYEYNQYNEVTAIKLGDETVASYAYDNLGRLTAESNGENGAARGYFYDAQGRLEHVTQTIRSRQYDLFYHYDLHDRVDNLTLKNAQGDVLAQFAYDHNAPSQSVSALVNGTMQSFGVLDIGPGGLLSFLHLGNNVSQGNECMRLYCLF